MCVSHARDAGVKEWRETLNDKREEEGREEEEGERTSMHGTVCLSMLFLSHSRCPDQNASAVAVECMCEKKEKEARGARRDDRKGMLG